MPFCRIMRCCRMSRASSNPTRWLRNKRVQQLTHPLKACRAPVHDPPDFRQACFIQPGSCFALLQIGSKIKVGRIEASSSSVIEGIQGRVLPQIESGCHPYWHILRELEPQRIGTEQGKQAETDEREGVEAHGGRKTGCREVSEDQRRRRVGQSMKCSDLMRREAERSGRWEAAS